MPALDTTVGKLRVYHSDGTEKKYRKGQFNKRSVRRNVHEAMEIGDYIIGDIDQVNAVQGMRSNYGRGRYKFRSLYNVAKTGKVGFKLIRIA